MRTLQSKSLGLAACLVTGVSAWLVGVTPASAKPPYLTVWRGIYPDSISDDNLINGSSSACQLCHVASSGDEPWNSYGWAIRVRFEQGMSINNAILAVEDLDSDSDPNGTTNILEIIANAQPGWTDGPNNVIFFEGGSSQGGQLPPADALGDLDPAVLCPADVNGDGEVGFSDLLAMLTAWGPCAGCPEDIDGSGDVGFNDLLAVLNGWGPC